VGLNLDELHKEVDASQRAGRWSFREGFLDTDRLRGIGYGNLVLRRQSHLYLAHGVIVSVILLVLFWAGSANWDRIAGVFGFFPDMSDDAACYTVITSVTQLPPPPPIDKPAAPKPPDPVVQAAPPKVEAPPNVGKVKQVTKAETPSEQTLATQEEIKKVIHQQPGAASGSVQGPLIEDGPVFVPCETMPGFLKQKKPRYPDIARRAGIEGKVIVSVLISENGHPVKAQVIKRIPADQDVFDDAAVEALMASTYTPGIQNGSPVKVWLTVPMRFELD
jgi:periplasmic protein TonB